MRGQMCAAWLAQLIRFELWQLGNLGVLLQVNFYFTNKALSTLLDKFALNENKENEKNTASIKRRRTIKESCSDCLALSCFSINYSLNATEYLKLRKSGLFKVLSKRTSTFRIAASCCLPKP